MKLYGEDDFDEMGDHTEEVLLPFDYNVAESLLKMKLQKSFSIADTQFLPLKNKLDKLLTDNDRKGDCLILMRCKKPNTPRTACSMGNQISKLFSKDSLVAWAAQSYDKYRFDFYLYDKRNFRVKSVMKGEELREYFRTEKVSRI